MPKSVKSENGGSPKKKEADEIQSSEEEEEEYEVEEIKKHRYLKNNKLEFFVSWVGYPSDQGNDSWIPEESAAGMPELVETYWASVNAKDPQFVRTKPKATVNPEKDDKKVKTEKKKRAGDDAPKEKAASKKRKTAAAAAAAEDEEEDHAFINYEEVHMQKADWEGIVDRIDAVEKDVDGTLSMYVVWGTDGYSWVPSKIARQKCPQKILDFYENHLRFKTFDQAAQ